MTKKEVVILLAEKHRLPYALVHDAVQMIFNGIIDTLVTEGRNRTSQLWGIPGQKTKSQKGA
jgi:nucleoid DNA-binding protein